MRRQAPQSNLSVHLRRLRPWLYRALLVEVVALCLSACSSGVPLQTKPFVHAEWHREAPVSVALLAESHWEPRYIGLVLRHDSRMDTISLPLELSLENYMGNLIWRDTIVLALANRPGSWLNPRVAVQEASWQSSQELKVPYAGLYYLRARPLRAKATPGVVSIGLGWSSEPQ